MYRVVIFLLLLWVGAGISDAPAQAPDAPALRTWQAVRIAQAPPVIDGRLDDAVWATAQPATGFVQRRPKPGAPATQRTEARLLYDDDALYVYARMLDTAPDSVAASLFRRDDSGRFSDWFYIQFDSYHDRRTAFSFAVNPRGVQKDFLLSDDVNDDLSWDAVWFAAAQLDAQGWTAEMRIPLSQLRFTPGDADQVWGVNMQRRIARNGEASYWSPTLPDADGFVSQFGDLHGISGLVPSRRLELQPYTAGKLARVQGDPVNPFFESNHLTGNAGLDLKYGLTSNLTLSATFSPDFGQVEVDPAVVNLSAFESFFSEKRPFFLEGSDIFEFGNTRTFNSYSGFDFFYSRRIGRNPQRRVGGDDIDYVQNPELTTIAAAAKVSGKTAGGWSVGLLNAVTPLERATFQRLDGTRGEARVEPATNYLASRLRKDYRGGQTVIGGMLTGVNRNLDDPALRTLLRSSAYAAGIDFQHALANRTYVLSGFFAGSRIAGAAEVIDAAQRSSARYFQRPDADYVTYDPSRTSLSGYAGELSFMKTGGQHWRYSLTYQETNPGFEVNDLGFLRQADSRAFSTSLVYQENDPGSVFRTYELWTWTTHAYNFGGKNLFTGFGTGGWAMFNNQWSINYNARVSPERDYPLLTRGGPNGRTPSDWSVNGEINTNENKRFAVEVGSAIRSDASGEYDRYVWMEFGIRPSSALQLEIEPTIGWEFDTDQFVTAIEDPLAVATFGTRYVMADMQSTNFSLDTRIDWTFAPSLSLQLFVQPLVFAGNFKAYKEFQTPDTYDFAYYGVDRGTLTTQDGTITVDPDGDGAAPAFSFDERDFNFASLRGNAVLRWEYSPGSTVFLVWQQQRSQFAQVGRFNLDQNVSDLLREPSDNIFLVKFSYWFGV